MRKFIIIFVSGLFMAACFAQKSPVVTYQVLEKRWISDSDTLYVVNFWATWCRPCIEELPAFQMLEKEFKTKPLKLILVSLDFPQHINTRVKPFLEKHNVKSEVFLLDDDANKWINRVNPEWDGSIPATLLVKKKKTSFYNQSFAYDELLQLVKPKLN